MKVLICSPFNGVVGGILRWSNNILSYLKDTNDGSLEIEILDFSRKINGHNIPNKFLKLIRAGFDYIYLVLKSIKAISKFKGEIIHITTPGSFLLLKDIILIKISHRYGFKTVVHFHYGRIPDLFVNRGWEYRLLIKVVSLSDKAIVIDNKSYSVLINEGFNNVSLLANPIAPLTEELITRNLSIKREQRKIVFAGYVIRTKGVYELVEACSTIPDIKLKIIGTVSDKVRAELFQMSGKTSSNWLEISGEKGYEETIKEMLSAGVFVLPTYTEGFPNVILESMACGCPIVTTDVGAIPEMLNIENNSHCGICVKPRDVESLRKAIIKMLDDRTYALECASNARSRVLENYSIQKVSSLLISIWKSTINN